MRRSDRFICRHALDILMRAWAGAVLLASAATSQAYIGYSQPQVSQNECIAAGFTWLEYMTAERGVGVGPPVNYLTPSGKMTLLHHRNCGPYTAWKIVGEAPDIWGGTVNVVRLTNDLRRPLDMRNTTGPWEPEVPRNPMPDSLLNKIKTSPTPPSCSGSDCFRFRPVPSPGPGVRGSIQIPSIELVTASPGYALASLAFPGEVPEELREFYFVFDDVRGMTLLEAWWNGESIWQVSGADLTVGGIYRGVLPESPLAGSNGVLLFSIHAEEAGAQAALLDIQNATPLVVPEPASWTMLIEGLGCLAVYTGRRRPQHVHVV